MSLPQVVFSLLYNTCLALHTRVCEVCIHIYIHGGSGDDIRFFFPFGFFVTYIKQITSILSVGEAGGGEAMGEKGLVWLSSYT